PVDVLEVVQPGQRINSIALTDEAGNTTEQLLQDGEWIADPNRPVRLVTLNFLAGAFTSSNVIGGDGYPFPAFGENIVELPNVLSDPGVFDFSNPGGEQDALAEYLWANFPPSAPLCQPETPVTLDTRIQQLLFRSDTVNFPPVSTGGKTLTKIGNFDTGIFDEAAAEIATFDADSQRIFFTNADAATVTILDASDPTNLSQVGEININRIFGFTWRGWTISANPNSVDVHDGLVAVAVNCEITTPNDKTYPTRGLVAFFNVYGHYVGKSWAGYGPDNLAFSPDGRKVVVANEGEPTDDYSFDPRGSVTVTSVTKKRRGYRFRTREASFRKFDKDELVDEGLRIFGPGASAAQDIEPEFVCISEDSRTAWVTLQENNGVAEVSLNRARITGITPLGTIDYMLESELDPSDRDDTINISTWPIQGFFHPDAIACYEKDGNTYLVTANEGDARDYDGFSEEERIKDIDLDPTAFPNAALLQEDEVLGRLNITTADGDTDGDGDFDELYAYGTRSFTIWCRDPQGNITRVYDSGAEFEKITATLIPTEFNSNNDENNSFESRSDNKGPEPEGVAVGEVDGRICAFIGLERVGGVMVYDVTNPEAPEFVEYITARDFSGDAEAGTAGDLGPEGLTFVSAEDSPTGKPLLIVANEVSGNVSVFEID
ncbi:MAG: choice-of-anchor I family protein, partial [Verrucomicrobiota bacterium]